MPRYFFDIDDGDRLVRDDKGLEFDDAAAAREEAMKAIPDVARDVMPDGNHRTIVVSVRGENDKPIFRAQLTLTAHWLD